MAELKPCPKRADDFWKCPCHVVALTTLEPAPKNIRMKCIVHMFVLPGSYDSLASATEAWNKMAALEGGDDDAQG